PRGSHRANSLGPLARRPAAAADDAYGRQYLAARAAAIEPAAPALVLDMPCLLSADECDAYFLRPRRVRADVGRHGLGDREKENHPRKRSHSDGDRHLLPVSSGLCRDKARRTHMTFRVRRVVTTRNAGGKSAVA